MSQRLCVLKHANNINSFRIVMYITFLSSAQSRTVLVTCQTFFSQSPMRSYFYYVISLCLGNILLQYEYQSSNFFSVPYFNSLVITVLMSNDTVMQLLATISIWYHRYLSCHLIILSYLLYIIS